MQMIGHFWQDETYILYFLPSPPLFKKRFRAPVHGRWQGRQGGLWPTWIFTYNIANCVFQQALVLRKHS